MKSDDKTVSLKSFAWTITLILILASFVFITLITNSKSTIVQNNIRVLQSGDNNYRRIDTCISVLYVAENNSRLFAVTADSGYLHKYTKQMQTVSSILTEFQEEKKKQAVFAKLYLPNLLVDKQFKNDHFIHMKNLVDSLLRFRLPEKNLDVPVANLKPYSIKTIRKIAKTDSIRIIPKRENKRLWRRLVDAVSNRPEDSTIQKVGALKSITTIEDTLALIDRHSLNAKLDNLNNLSLARNQLNKAEMELLAINNRIFSNLQAALKTLKAEEIENVEKLRMSLLLQTSDKVEELSQLSWGNIAVVLILTMMIIWNIIRLYKNEITLISYSNLIVDSAKKKGEFLSHVSHEIRTPLNSIIGFSKQMSEEVLSENLRMKVNSIKNSSDVLLMLINEILDFSKFESGKIKLVNRAFTPFSLLKDTFEMLSVLAANKEIAITTEFNLDPELVLEGDDFRLKQVIINVLNNAIKFTSAKGKINLSAEFVKGDKTDEGMLKVVVQDSGVGIAENDLEKIFEDFTQIEIPGEARQSGTGLGLPISKRIVELFRGKIKVKSKVGQGSVFSIEVPLKVAREASIVTNVNNNKAGIDTLLKGRKILIVDDIKINLLLLSRIMDKNGVPYDIASDGEEAYHLFKSTKYDLIISDIQMPKMDGLTLTRVIREDLDFSKSKIPVIAYTGSVSEEEKSKFLNGGMNDVLYKPFTESDLIGVLSRIIF